MSLSSHQSAASQTCDWLTPPEWIGVLGPFDIDPCASIKQPWRTADLQFSERGLDITWNDEDGEKLFAWMNPPYGPPKVIEPWMKAMSQHNHGIACIPARVETACWFKYVWPVAELVLFAKGRPHFHFPITGKRAKANSGAPIALIGYGRLGAARLYSSGIEGQMVRP